MATRAIRPQTAKNAYTIPYSEILRIKETIADEKLDELEKRNKQ